MRLLTAIIAAMGIILMLSLIGMGIYDSIYEIGEYGGWFAAAFLAFGVTVIATAAHEYGWS